MCNINSMCLRNHCTAGEVVMYCGSRTVEECNSWQREVGGCEMLFLNAKRLFQLNLMYKNVYRLV